MGNKKFQVKHFVTEIVHIESSITDAKDACQRHFGPITLRDAGDRFVVYDAAGERVAVITEK